MIRQCDLSGFAEGARLPPGGDVDDEGEVVPSPPPATGYRGRKCAKCGAPLNGGGNVVVGWGRVCWSCYHSNLGRRDGRGDLSSDASGSRNSGYNLRR